MLRRNDVHTDRKTAKNERIKAEEVENLIQQSPNKRFLGTNLNLWIYCMSNPAKDNWPNRFLRSLGTAPVILDLGSARISSQYIRNYVHSRGYRDGTSSYSIDSARRRATANYYIVQNEPYRIGNITYVFEDKLLESTITENMKASLLHTGDPLDKAAFEAERQRIKELLQVKGYYNFTTGNIGYVGDSTGKNRMVDVGVVVKKFMSGYNADGSPHMENNPIYRIGRINVFPDYDPMRAATDTSYLNHLDSTYYKGLNIVYGQKLRIREKVLHGNIPLRPNYLYNTADVTATNRNLMRLDYYKSARVVFADAPDSTGSRVTYVGGGDAEGEQTDERYLICNIYCTPAQRQRYNIGLETTFTSDYYGLSANLGYRNRSLFRGVETFDITLTGSYDFMRVQGKKASFEFGGATSITFPRFVLPAHIPALDRVRNPRSRAELSINGQRRPYYHRVLSNAAWGYSWNGNSFTTFTIKPIDVGAVKVNYIDDAFLESLQNPYLKDSYRSQLLAGISGSWVYNNSMWNKRGNALSVRLNAETMGNLLNGIYSTLGKGKADADGSYEIFGMPYAQYARADLSITGNIPFTHGGKASIAYRFYTGGGISYGNSSNVAMPYDRLFYAGGSNSMRGWPARTIGPGSQADPAPDSYPSQVGNVRLEANLETRFPIWSIVRGAVFCDVGNVWAAGHGDYDEAAMFRFDNFYRQLGFSAGVGLRFDISMAILRADWGVRIHDPNLPSGRRWIHSPDLSDTALCIAVAYPF